MDNTNQPVKPAIEPTNTRTILSIGSRDFQLDPRIGIDSAIHIMRLLSLGVSAISTDWDSDTSATKRVVGPREVIALQLVPATEGEVAK